jgi:hypothetical protein
MKLVLREVTRQRELTLDLDTLAVSYGLTLPVGARVYETEEEFLALLEDSQEVQDVGHDDALD